MSDSEIIAVRDLKFVDFNHEKYADAMANVTKEQVIHNIRLSAEVNYNNLLQNLKELESDEERARAVILKIDHFLDKKQEKINQLRREGKDIDYEIERVIQENENIGKEMQEKKACSQTYAPDMDLARKNIQTCRDEVTQTHLKAIMKYLDQSEKKIDAGAIFVMEALVGLLRGEKKASPSSVKVYI